LPNRTTRPRQKVSS